VPADASELETTPADLQNSMNFSSGMSPKSSRLATAATLTRLSVLVARTALNSASLLVNTCRLRRWRARLQTITMVALKAFTRKQFRASP
jgi:hypothetical protein